MPESLALIVGLIIVALVIWNESKKREQSMNQITDKSEPPKKAQGDEALMKPLYARFLNVPIWAIYFLILSTVLLTVLILARIWMPELFDEDFFWKIVYSYLTLIVSTFVISQMAEAIKFVKDKG